MSRLFNNLEKIKHESNKNSIFVTNGIICAALGDDALDKEITESLFNGNPMFTKELLKALKKAANKKSELEAEQEPGHFIGAYNSAKGLFYIKQDTLNGTRWIYTAAENESVKQGTCKFIGI